MSRRHSTGLRLVVNNSSSESLMPRCRANPSKRKCHLPGILSRTDHMATALYPTSRSRPNCEGPPKRDIISEVSIAETNITFSDSKSTTKSDTALLVLLSQTVTMGIKGIERLEPKQIRKLAAERVLDVFRTMESQGEGPVRFAKRMML